MTIGVIPGDPKRVRRFGLFLWGESPHNGAQPSVGRLPQVAETRRLIMVALSMVVMGWIAWLSATAYALFSAK